MSYEKFKNELDNAIVEFTNDNALLERIVEGNFDSTMYRSLLTHLHYQTLKAPVSFAIAGANCCRREQWRKVGDYLIEHANEENGHYRWLEDDAQALGGLAYQPDRSPPPPATSMYVSFNFYIAQEFPVGRLAIAAFLEGVAARVGPRYMADLMHSTGLDQSHFTFLISHATTDAQHIVEIDQLIRELEMNEDDWAWMSFCASTASMLYRNIYNHVASTVPQQYVPVNQAEAEARRA